MKLAITVTVKAMETQRWHCRTHLFHFMGPPSKTSPKRELLPDRSSSREHADELQRTGGTPVAHEKTLRCARQRASLYNKSEPQYTNTTLLDGRSGLGAAHPLAGVAGA